MDMGPFGASRSTSSRGSGAATRREPAPARTGSSEVAHEEQAAHRAAAATPHTVTAKKQPRQKKSFKWVIIAVVALGLVVGGWVAWQKLASADGGIESSKYQAVFLSNGQVYFGKLQSVNDQYLKLTNVFYIQGSSTDTDTSNSEDPQQSTTANSDRKLIKLGKEVHGPEDAIIINRDHVQFYENLKSDGEVAKLISQYKE